MSLAVIERETWLYDIGHPWIPWNPKINYEIVDPNARDGEWHAVITMAHEIVEWEGLAVPAFKGDVERIEWERAHYVSRR